MTAGLRYRVGGRGTTLIPGGCGINVQEVVFRFTPSLMGGYDRPEPPIPHLAGVILLQRGEALVGVWDAECCGFVHPANQRELAGEALAAVLAAGPGLDPSSAELRVFTCPPELVARFDFGAWHDEWVRGRGADPANPVMATR